MTLSPISPSFWLAASTLAPAVLMLLALCVAPLFAARVPLLWRAFSVLSYTALAGTVVAAYLGAGLVSMQPWLAPTALGAGLAVLVQLLGTVIGAFSARYLQGEAAQVRYVAALAGVLAAVHLLLLADHWVVLIAAWALVGVALQHLLTFYADRPFALLAAHKKRLADRLADGLLLAAAALAWGQVGSGSLSALWAHLDAHGTSAPLQASAVLLVLAVILRTALLPVHGWLTQVMEAPTPVSALLHAGVVNLGGFVLIRFAPLLALSTPASAVLVVFGLGTAVLAGLVMLTRVSIKVRLAWSTVAQMGFMVLECGLGLYTLAALHLMGHSLYKAHAFLAASGAVRNTRLQAMHGAQVPAPLSLWLAPLVAVVAVLLIQLLPAVAPTMAPASASASGLAPGIWPWWWSAVLGLAWAPLLWVPAQGRTAGAVAAQLGVGALMVAGLAGLTLLLHALPMGLTDAPRHALGVVALAGMAALYLCLVALQLRPQALATWRRWSYAGFYVDGFYTRLTLRLWPARWTAAPAHTGHPLPLATAKALPSGQH